MGWELSRAELRQQHYLSGLHRQLSSWQCLQHVLLAELNHLLLLLLLLLLPGGRSARPL
jgi:hypothetical protein